MSRLAATDHHGRAGGRRRASTPSCWARSRTRGKLREVTYAGWPLHSYKFAYSAQASVINIGIKQFGGQWYALEPGGQDRQVAPQFIVEAGLRRRREMSRLFSRLGVLGVALAASMAHWRQRRSRQGAAVGTYKGVHGQYTTIQAAANAAKPGDWILIGPGDYKTSSTEAPKGPRGRPGRRSCSTSRTCSSAA